MNTKETKRVITELAACEKQLDSVLFDSNLGTAAGLGGLGAGAYLYGRKGMRKPPTFAPADIGATIGRGVQKVGTDIQNVGGDLWQNLLKWGKRGLKNAAKVVE